MIGIIQTVMVVVLVAAMSMLALLVMDAAGATYGTRVDRERTSAPQRRCVTRCTHDARTRTTTCVRHCEARP
ncbi:MAG TPA: hypothetical protein VG758_21165 [Hyphomicrobiaceae bacterium]|jgi:hypothetical protein|nr:hypothetical protein [Hyphomicrobiaceae bacterium]